MRVCTVIFWVGLIIMVLTGCSAGVSMPNVSGELVTGEVILVDVEKSFHIPSSWQIIKDVGRRESFVGGKAVAMQPGSHSMSTTLQIGDSGSYYMWIHYGGDKNYRFLISIDGQEVDHDFVGNGLMQWTQVGEFTLAKGPVEIRVHDVKFEKSSSMIVVNDPTKQIVLDAIVFSKDFAYSPEVFGAFKADAGQDVFGRPGQRITFNGGRSRSPVGYLEHHWFFEDGTESNDPFVDKVFAEEGTYTARLVVHVCLIS